MLSNPKCTITLCNPNRNSIGLFLNSTTHSKKDTGYPVMKNDTVHVSESENDSILGGVVLLSGTIANGALNF